MTNEELLTQIREHAGAMAAQCEAISNGTVVNLKAATRLVQSNADILASWAEQWHIADVTFKLLKDQ